MSGYVRLYRCLVDDHPAFINDAQALAFAWMIARAAWSPVCVTYKGRKIELQRGQLAISQRDMARRLDRDKAWVERLWKRLRDEAMVEAVVEAGGEAGGKAGVTVLTICNYDEYQAGIDGDEAPHEAARKAATRQRRATEQEREESKKGKKEESVAKATSAFAMPAGVDPDHWRDFLANRKRKRLPNTPSAHKRLMDDLERVSAKRRMTFAQLIEHAAAHGWAGIYDPFERRGHDGREEHPLGKTGAAVQAVLNGFGEGITELEEHPRRPLGGGKVVALPRPARFGD